MPLQHNSLGDAAQLPVPDEQRQEIDFLVRAHALADVARFNRLVSDARAESSAEHSWHLVLAAMAFERYTPPDVDLGRVMRMLVLHDLAEITTGDVVIFDELARQAVEARERAAAEELFARLPNAVGSDFAALWAEFTDGVTPSARFARAIDRLQPIIIHWAGAGQAWASRGITRQQELRVAEQVAHFHPALGELAYALVNDAARRGLLPPETP